MTIDEAAANIPGCDVFIVRAATSIHDLHDLDALIAFSHDAYRRLFAISDMIGQGGVIRRRPLPG